MNRNEIASILSEYSRDKFKDFEIQPFGAGLIHGTYLIETKEEKFILQEFNTAVFNYPDRISHNQRLINSYGDVSQLPFELPLPIVNSAGKLMTKFESKLFRLFDFVDGNTIQKISHKSQAFIAAEAYGIMAAWAQVVPSGELMEIIPDFHRLDLRFAKFLEVAQSSENLTVEEQELLEFYRQKKALVDEYVAYQQVLPQHLTHNDTKINNLIFSKDLQEVKAVVDLDTLMSGYLLYDFGDLIRTVSCSEAETSTNWESIRFELGVFEELLKGYYAGIKSFATAKEIDSLLIAGEVMICIMGLRFFTDHLQGNVYYKVQYPEQNFDRAKNQMILLKSLEESKAQILQVWEKITEVNA